MRISKYLKRIQNLPLIKRKIIFWAVLIILALILSFFYIKSIERNIKTFPKSDTFKKIKLPRVREKLEKLQKPEIPKSKTEGNLKKLEEMNKETK